MWGLLGSKWNADDLIGKVCPECGMDLGTRVQMIKEEMGVGMRW